MESPHRHWCDFLLLINTELLSVQSIWADNFVSTEMLGSFVPAFFVNCFLQGFSNLLNGMKVDSVDQISGWYLCLRFLSLDDQFVCFGPCD